MYRSDKNLLGVSVFRRGFTLVEVVAATVILSVIFSTVLVIINRAIETTIDTQTKMQAFELARENMEKLLGAETAKEMAEFGYHETNPDIQWETTVEHFYEPITDRMWLQAICMASYTDSTGEQQSVELTHWLTNISKEDMLKILEQEKKEKEQLTEEQLIEYAEVLADNAGISFEFAMELLQMDRDQAVKALAEETGMSAENAEMLLGLGLNDVISRLALAAGISPTQAAEVLQKPVEEREKAIEDFGGDPDVIDDSPDFKNPDPPKPEDPPQPTPKCGDGNCDPGENSTTCPQDCGGDDKGDCFFCCIPCNELADTPFAEIIKLWQNEQKGLCDCE